MWPEVGLTITLLQGWRRNDDGDDNTVRSWIALDSSKFTLRVTTTAAIAGTSIKVVDQSIEEDTTHFYETHKKYGEQDLRYLDIDGVRGVHYLRDDKGFDAHFNSQNEKYIIWNGQRMYGDQRQVINVTLTSPSHRFAKDRDLLYGLMASIKFNSSDTAAPASGTPATDQSPEAAGVTTSDSVVLSIPSDGEFYFGKRRIELAEIPGEVDKLLRDRPANKQGWYVKALPEVTCATVIGLRDDIAALGYEQMGLLGNKGTQATVKNNPTRQTSTNPEEQPKSSSPPANEKDQGRFDVHIGLSKTGTLMIKINETEVLPTQLANKMQTFRASHPGNGVIISAAPTVSYGSLMSVIDQLKTGGAERIGLGLEKG